jgi:HEXXH motif-containing protein
MRRGDVADIKRHLSKIASYQISQKLSSDVVEVTSLGDSEWELFSAIEAARAALVEFEMEEHISGPTAENMRRIKERITSTLNTLSDINVNLYNEFHDHVASVKIFESNLIQGFSDVRVMGCIFIRVPPKKLNSSLYYLEHLIHEMAHIQLNTVLLLDPILNEDRNKQVASPIRPDLRPLFGTLHATYVTAKVGAAFYDLFKKSNNPIVLRFLAQIMGELVVGLEIINRQNITDAGKKLIASMESAISSIATDDAWLSYDFSRYNEHRWGGGSTHSDKFARYLNR